MFSDPLPIEPLTGPLRGSVRPPGSKSLTNRALVVASLAEGTSRLLGALDSIDTRVMLDSLGRMGIALRHDSDRRHIEVQGCAGRPPARSARLWTENSGTSMRFLAALCTLAEGTFHLDGNPRMRERPIGDLVDALNALGADVVSDAGNGRPPLTVRAKRLPGGVADVAGDVSSQFLSGLLMVAPTAQSPIELQVAGDLVSGPYVAMTLAVMAAFGVAVQTSDRRCYRVEPAQYRARVYEIEPDASAASYFFAAAALTGGQITVEGLSRDSLQGDVAFVDVLEQMGCRVDRQVHGITIAGGPLCGVDVDMNSISDTVPTLAAVAPFASGPTRIRNVAHIRHKETDRIAAVAAELRRMGIRVDEQPDGLTIHPGEIRPARIETYDDHRMAMSFALVGLRAPGIQICDPGCTAKTYPGYFDDLNKLRG
jgi:3-phosphoshikimate 1-carboxyvinyltransferase